MDPGNATAEQDRRTAFEAVVSAYEGALLRYAVRIIRQHDAAQNIVQDTFLRLLKTWEDEMKPSPQISSWLYCVAHNCAVDHLRREHRLALLHLRQAQEHDDFAMPDLGEGVAISEDAERAAAALKALSLREQQIVILKVYEEKSYAEIAQITDLTTGNVGYILHHAMKKLGKQLSQVTPP